MVLENFKSYGGMKRIGPFHKSFSSVVGPNGSGKSNVIDAMLFVFGKRANKLRQSKVADLIHRSATYPDLEHASVAVHFCMIQEGAAAAASGAAIADDGSAEVPGSAFVVERRAFRNNTSRYYVDGKGASQKEVTDMLRGKGIDLDHNRFLILQGEVEQISLMKPKGATEHETGLLEYLEDIIGSHRFVDDIAAAFTDVEALATERDEKLNRVRVADRSRQELAGQREDALHMLKCSSDVSTAKARLYQARAYKAQRKLDAVAEKRAGFEEQLETERRRLADAEERAEAAAGAAEAAVAAVESARGRMRELDAEFGELEKRDITVREAHKHAKGRMRKLHALVNAQRTKAAEAAATVEELEEATPTMEGELAEAEAAQGPAEEEVKAALDNLRASTAGLRSELNARQAALAPVAERRAVAHAAVEKLEAEASMLRQGSAQATAEAERLAREVARHERELSGAEARADKAAENLTGVAGRLDTAREAMAETRAAEAKATRRAASARAMLEENKSAQERAAGQGRVVQKLSAACAAKGSPMSGVRLYGRLGDLGAVDPSLDVAVSTAAAALEWLVVESTEDGQRCIEHLRRNNLGRAKFLVLDKQGAAAAAMAKPVRLPAGARRLFDLVEADEERFLPAFFFALRNTLVADDIDAARAVAYQGGRAVWRVVTLQGELIDTSGTMSGGGGRPRTGSIRLSSSSSSSSSSRAASAASAPAGGMTASDLRAAEKALHEASDEATALADRATATGREIRSLETMLRAAETAARKARAEVQSLTERLAELRIRSAKADRAAADAKEREETAAERLAEVEEALVAAREGLAEVDEEAGSLRGAVEELEARIQEAGGARLEAAKAASKSIAAAVASGRKAVTKAGVELKAAAKAAAKAGAAAKSAEEEYHALAEKLETTSGEKAAVEADAARVAGAKADAEAALAEAEAASGAARKAAKTSRKELSAISAHVEDVEKAGASVIATGKQLKAAVAEVTKTLAAVRRAHEALLKDIPLDEEEGDVLAEAEVEARAAAEAGAGEEKEDEEGSDGEEASDASSSSATAASGGRGGLGIRRSLPEMTDEECEEASEADLVRRLAVAEDAIAGLGRGANARAIEQYRAKHAEYVSRAAELDEVTSRRDAARRSWDGLRKQRLEAFMSGFRAITLKLKEMYRMITLGGDAELELVDSLDPFSEGILFTVRPPKKSWKRMSNLSGGEKTLSSLALVFALHHFKPTPLYVMDEIDAALDFKNVSVVAHYLKQRTDMAQFIIISLRNNMFELADRLVGIYKTHDVTKSVTIDPKRFAAAAGVETGAEEAEARIAAAGKARPARAATALADRTNV